MKKTKKRLLGCLAVAIVVATAAIAYSIVLSKADAISSLTDTIIVRVFDKYPKVTTTFPQNESVVVGEKQTMTYDWQTANTVSYTLLYNGEIIDTWTDEYGIYEPGQYPSGSNSHEISLPGYGKYILESVATNEVGTYEDSTVFYRLATKVEVIDVEENGDPQVRISYDKQVKHLSIQVEDENGRPLFSEPIIVDVSVNTETGSLEMTIPMPEGTSGGTYRIVVSGLDENNILISDPDSTEFAYEPPAPDVPDTGEVLNNINIARNDIVITGLLVFLVAVIMAFVIIYRKKEQ